MFWALRSTVIVLHLFNKVGLWRTQFWVRWEITIWIIPFDKKKEFLMVLIRITVYFQVLKIVSYYFLSLFLAINQIFQGHSRKMTDQMELKSFDLGNCFISSLKVKVHKSYLYKFNKCTVWYSFNNNLLVHTHKSF